MSKKDKPPISTSLLTGSVLCVFTAVYATLNLWISVVSTGLVALCWLILAAQKSRMK